MTVTNRTWDTQAGPGFVRWDSEFPDATGQGYPGPGTFGTHTSDYTISRGAAEVVGPEVSPDDTFSPVERWLFSGTLLGENGVDDFSVTVGVEAYLPGPISGTQGRSYVHDTRDDTPSPVSASLVIRGDMSIQYWVYKESFVDTFGNKFIECAFSSNGGIVNDPIVYGSGISTAQPAGRITHGWENQAGGAEYIDIGPSDDITLDEWTHVIWTRDVSGGVGACISQIWINGVKASESTTLDPVNTNGVNPIRIRIGNSNLGNAQALVGRLHGVAIYSRFLTQAEIVALYKKGIPEVDR